MQRSCATRGHSRVVSAPACGGRGGSNSSSEQPIEVESSVASTDASLRTRGATQGIIRKLPLGSKKRIHVHKKIFIEDEARSTIGAIFRANMNFPFVVWSSWKKYPEMKEMLWQKFLGYFDFESPEQEAMGKIAFFHHISTNYAKWMEGARKFAVSKVGEDAHPHLWRNHPPDWIRNDVWQKMVDVWATTKWQEKSRCAKTNQSANDEPSHTGGFVPHAIIGVELKEKMSEISEARLKLEVYELTHKLKRDPNGQPLEDQDRPYVSKKAKAIRDAYAVRFDEISSQEPNSSLVDYDAAELWRETPGVCDKKGHIRGSGVGVHGTAVAVEGKVTATDATEDDNDDTFDELGG
ncbi:hypothetical protein RJ639_016635 [Escallonia herrerae]|uniref:Transposase n=1 Tax=Escallonia herrerae TaxID=1293975 RepID=A0AA88VGV9_9ASTE|nr:hypothetical protein RJ639_016635 [Escallonia herrerae]